ncbi:uncharacterized protein O3C94_006985 [Discoglossus pictus]
MGYAKNAIDGKSDGNYRNGFCTHTDQDSNPWWKVDLKQTYKVQTIVVTNRQDCCGERLKGAEVRVGNSPDNNNPVCGTINDVSKPTITLCCNGMEGQYVSVVIPGRAEFLSLCEVEVYEDLVQNDAHVCWLSRDFQKVQNTPAIQCQYIPLMSSAGPSIQLRMGEQQNSQHLPAQNNVLGPDTETPGRRDQKNPPSTFTVTDSSLFPIKRWDCEGPESVAGPRNRLGRMKLLVLLAVLGSLVVAQRCEPDAGANLARNGEATQSSDFKYTDIGYAKNAIDGKTDGNYHNGFCTHTDQDSNPWWKVDLKQTYKVQTIVVTNRQECCGERLKGAEVRVGKSPDNDNPVCGTINDVSKPTITLCCNGMEGQYVSVVIPGRAEYLTLCELEVYGDLVQNDAHVCASRAVFDIFEILIIFFINYKNISIYVVTLKMKLLVLLAVLGPLVAAQGCGPGAGAINLARNGESTQSSDFKYAIMGYAKNAIDGKSDGNYHSGSCTHTNQDSNPWWKVDLKQSYKVQTIVVANRQDCCSDRLKGAEVRVGNSPDNDNPVCGTITDVSKPTITLCCNGMEGQYVSVVIPKRAEYLTLCEVEVYGDLVENDAHVCW